MKLVIVTVGTRGDVEPYLHVGRALTRRGHEVRLAAHEEFRAVVEQAGLSFTPMRGGMRELSATEAGRAWMASADRPLEYARRATEIFGPLQRSWFEDADAAAEGCDAVLFYGVAGHAVEAAERRGLPAIALCPWPTWPSASVPPPTAAWLDVLPGWAMPRAWDLLTRATFGFAREAWREHRARVGLPPPATPTIFHRMLEERLPVIQLFSAHALARPTDWPSNVHVAGFSFGEAPAYAPSPALEAFLARRDRPIVYVGFGSMTGLAPEELGGLVRDAGRARGVRVVYGAGWAGHAPAPSEDFFVVDDVPHAWLFPRVDAVVHHGGVGTFAEGLRAGRPTVVVAFFADQPFWGKTNERLGTGPRALRRKGLTAAALAGAIEAAVSTPSYREAASELAARLAREDGAARAAELVEEIVAGTRRG